VRQPRADGAPRGLPALLALQPALERLYADFNLAHSTRDPIWTVRRYADPADQEVAAFIAAVLAFGNVQSVLNSIDAVLAVMAPSPAAFLRQFTPAQAPCFEPLVHRWIGSLDLAALTWQLHLMLRDHGSIEGFFRAGGAGAGEAPIDAALESFSTRAMSLDLTPIYGRRRPRPGVAYFFSRPSSGGACKRLNLFLRWMVRRDAVDLGLWSAVRPSQLVVPLDTHIIRVGRCLGLTARVSPGWKMAADITATLRRLAPDDPVRYDFAMCHLGMMGACGFGTTCASTHCPLAPVCRPGRRPALRRVTAVRG
jgi:uncharacterized protein (TIGR02757 family)